MRHEDGDEFDDNKGYGEGWKDKDDKRPKLIKDDDMKWKWQRIRMIKNEDDKGWGW